MSLAIPSGPESLPIGLVERVRATIDCELVPRWKLIASASRAASGVTYSPASSSRCTLCMLSGAVAEGGTMMMGVEPRMAWCSCCIAA
jgi:hypothetical protein